MLYGALIVLVCGVVPSYCMDNPDPAQIIQQNILQPVRAMKRLGNFRTSALTNYHDESYNNLLHITIQELVKHKNDKHYSTYQETSKPLIRYLALKGVDINEVNDHHSTPIGYAYGALPVDPQTRVISPTADFNLTDFLEGEMGADPTWFSIYPQIRTCKKKLYALLCCCRCKRRDRQQIENR